jgi:hypothetical protein
MAQEFLVVIKTEGKIAFVIMPGFETKIHNI